VVDEESEQILGAAILRILWDRLLERDDVTRLVVSNREAVLRRADQVVVPEEGRLESLQVRKGRLWQAPLSKASSPS